MSGWAQREAEAHERGECNCEQSLGLTKRLDVCLEALDAIRSVCLRGEAYGKNTASIEWVGSILALAEANLERIK